MSDKDITSCNGAAMAGYTQEAIIESGTHSLHVMIRPGTDFDDEFRAFCTDEMEMIAIKGWMIENLEMI